MMRESDILYQTGPYWVCKGDYHGYEVHRDGMTHATRCAIIGYTGTKGLELAMREADKRAALDTSRP